MDEAKLRKQIRDMIRLERAKPEMTVLVGGDERQEVNWDELEDDLSLALARYFFRDLMPAHIASTRKVLEEVKRDVIDVKVFNHAACAIDGKTHDESCAAQTKLQAKQRQKLDTLINRLEESKGE